MFSTSWWTEVLRLWKGKNRKLIALIGGLTRRCLHWATGAGSADMLSFHVEKKEGEPGTGAELLLLLFFFFQGEAQGGHPHPALPWPTVKVRLGPGMWAGGRGGCRLPTVLGSHLCWQGLAIKYWPPWQPRSVVLSDEECRAPGSVLNTS